MPFAPPPTSYTGSPRPFTLRAGTTLWRVHQRTYRSTEFNPTPSHRYFGGGRFDATDDDRYPYIYAGSTELAAAAERLVRSIPFDDDGWRYLRHADLRNRRLSAIEVAADITLISLLDTASLADACQDEWLIHTEGREYVQTRHWAHWLRSVAPWAQGLIWPSKRDLGAKVTVLFADRCDPGSLRPGTTHIDLDTRAGRRWLNLTLRPLRVSVHL